MIETSTTNPSYADRLQAVRKTVASMARTKPFETFEAAVRRESSWRFRDNRRPERYLHNVEHHLCHFVPRLLGCWDERIHTVLDFGCGSGSASIALALLFPETRFQGVDISTEELAIAQARATLYEVGDRCRFDSIDAGQTLPFVDGTFDLCICCSVLEYVTDTEIRKHCVQEMARLIAPGGLLFVTVPNRLYPVEIHSHKLGWNYFPHQLKARMTGSCLREVRKMARPHVLMAYHTPWTQRLTPWTNFCLKKTS